MFCGEHSGCEQLLNENNGLLQIMTLDNIDLSLSFH